MRQKLYADVEALTILRKLKAKVQRADDGRIDGPTVTYKELHNWLLLIDTLERILLTSKKVNNETTT